MREKKKEFRKARCRYARTCVCVCVCVCVNVLNVCVWCMYVYVPVSVCANWTEWERFHKPFLLLSLALLRIPLFAASASPQSRREMPIVLLDVLHQQFDLRRAANLALGHRPLPSLVTGGGETVPRLCLHPRRYTHTHTRTHSRTQM